ncbi:LysE family transporter [Bradyrhizobium sp. 182]|uniref:LysE family transporter n=1 Tax=unclassified Bradyrhizobium TaxID=2631580 RepID=UPI001FFBD54C|nr:LysE family transporter [Bradyrhizobium sp. 182]
MASAEAFTALKIAGALYLIWLGIKTWREARVPAPAEVQTTALAVHCAKASSWRR